MKTRQSPGYIIPYPGSPSNGKAYTGVAKHPFMPVKNGYGFMGILMQTTDREYVQCHGCGAWMKTIGKKHLENCLKIDTRTYKKRFGLKLAPGLVSTNTSLRLAENALKAQANIDRFSRESQTYSAFGGRGEYHHPIEVENRTNTCPAQLSFRLIEFVRENHELPARGNRGAKIYKALRRRYETWGFALKAHGLPFFERKGTTMYYTFPDGSKYHYNINQMYDRKLLYRMMVKKCKVLKSS